jgi:acyl carrier protein
MTQTATQQQVEARVLEAIASFGADPDLVSRDASFQELDVDSLDLVELAQIAEEEYGVELRSEDMKQLHTVGDAIDLIVARAS